MVMIPVGHRVVVPARTSSNLAVNELRKVATNFACKTGSSLIEEEAPSLRRKRNLDHRSRRDLKLKFTVLAKTNLNLADRPTDRPTGKEMKKFKSG
jgi:hypothetical protein